MPDQKISSQPEHTTDVLGVDLIALVATVATTPTNYRVQVKNFLSRIAIDLPQTDYSGMKVTTSVTANALTHLQAAGEFVMMANAALTTLAHTKNRYGLIGRNIIQNGNSDVIGQCAAAMFELDTGNTTTVSSNTFGVLIRHFANTIARYSAPTAYIGISEDANTGAETLYLMDIGAEGKVVSGDEANVDSSAIFTQVDGANTTISHALKVRVNGIDLWVLASNVAPV